MTGEEQVVRPPVAREWWRGLRPEIVSELAERLRVWAGEPLAEDTGPRRPVRQRVPA